MNVVLTINSTFCIFTKTYNMTFGEKLKEIRRAQKISQRELAKIVGVDFSYISKIENDRMPPPAADTIIKLSNALDIPEEILLSESGKLPSNVKNMVNKKPNAVLFFRQAERMNLSTEEWDELMSTLKNLR